MLELVMTGTQKIDVEKLPVKPCEVEAERPSLTVDEVLKLGRAADEPNELEVSENDCEVLDAANEED